MVRSRSTAHILCAKIINNRFFPLSAQEKRLVGREIARRFRQHIAACARLGFNPEPIIRFCEELADEIKRGTYQAPQRLTAIHDDGCRKLLVEIFITAERVEKLRGWHAHYMLACEISTLPAYALDLILDAVHHTAKVPDLKEQPLHSQAEQINAIVGDYVKRAGRKENPRWYAKKTAANRKPSKVFNKYGD